MFKAGLSVVLFSAVFVLSTSAKGGRITPTARRDPAASAVEPEIKEFGTCVKKGKAYVPSNLEEAMAELERIFGKNGINAFRKQDPIIYHHGLGTMLRNCWGLWAGGSNLGKWFAKHGITHPDDMSSIVFTSLHRRLNRKPIDLKGQIKYYQDYWKKRRTAYETGAGSGDSVVELVPFQKGEGWIHVRGEKIPYVIDLYQALEKHAGKAFAACWKRFPKTPGSSAVKTFIRITIDKSAKVSSAKVLKTAIPAKDAACMARSFLGAKSPRHAGSSYTLILSSYRMVDPQ